MVISTNLTGKSQQTKQRRRKLHTTTTLRLSHWHHAGKADNTDMESMDVANAGQLAVDGNGKNVLRRFLPDAPQFHFHPFHPGRVCSTFYSAYN